MDKPFTRDEIKEAILIQKPRADLMSISKAGISYITFVKWPYAGGERKYPVYFNVQLKDVGERIWGTSEKSAGLIDFICTTNR